MAGNSNLARANREKNDEFYTRLTDIEKELRYYRKHFKGKTVFCNCDDPFESNFFKYFVLNFNRLGLRKLITTCYTTSPVAHQQLSLFDIMGNSEESKDKPYKAVVSKVYDATGDGGIDMFDVKELFLSGENELTELEGDGDFRSDECIELLKESDIVVTNPPFSLFREYVAQLVEYEKDFLIIGNQNAITYKEIFPLLKDNTMWLGVNNPAPKLFYVPSLLEERNNISKDEEGNLVASFGNACWFTNLDIRKRHEELILVKKYNPDEHSKYDNYDAINVNRVKDIPYDYDGVMGVPITFLDKYSPEQFEILGISQTWATDFEFGKSKVYEKGIQYSQDGKASNGSKVNDGAVIAYEIKPSSGVYYKAENSNKYLVKNYVRLFVRNKHPEINVEVD
ncbi:MAG: adenine-specific methyltransferase EcoRI family protein [Tissierellia bacterium]|nr:adenine-specific methyltransferase EcoRI family protein [Tissierellia bacterium]